MGCSSTSTVTNTQPSLVTHGPRSRYATYKEEIREMYTIKNSITFNSTTGLFYGEEMSTLRDPVFIRFSRIAPAFLSTIAKRLDTLKSHEAEFTHLLPYYKIGQTRHFLYLVTKTKHRVRPLLEAITMQSFSLTETSLCLSFCPIFATLAKMHEAGVIHGQITPFKILLMKDSCYLYDPCVGTESTGDRVAESYPFLSPEDLAGEPPSLESDVWSIGAVLYYLITGHYVFNATTCADCVESSRLKEPDFSDPVWMLLSPTLKDLVQKMLHKSRWSRIKMQDVVMHEWAQGNVVGEKDVVLDNASEIALDYRRAVCTQKTKYSIANDKSVTKIREIQGSLQSLDFNHTRHLDYASIIQCALGGHDARCENCEFFWEDELHYQSFMTDTIFLNSLIMHERLSVLFGQLSHKKECLDGDDIKRMLNGIAHADYTVSDVFEDLVRTYQNPRRKSLTLTYTEFVEMCQCINFAPVEGFVIGGFF